MCGATYTYQVCNLSQTNLVNSTAPIYANVCVLYVNFLPICCIHFFNVYAVFSLTEKNEKRPGLKHRYPNLLKYLQLYKLKGLGLYDTPCRADYRRSLCEFHFYCEMPTIQLRNTILQSIKKWVQTGEDLIQRMIVAYSMRYTVFQNRLVLWCALCQEFPFTAGRCLRVRTEEILLHSCMQGSLLQNSYY